MFRSLHSREIRFYAADFSWHRVIPLIIEKLHGTFRPFDRASKRHRKHFAGLRLNIPLAQNLTKSLVEYPIILLKQINSNNIDLHLIPNKYRHSISIQEKENTNCYHDFVKIRN